MGRKKENNYFDMLIQAVTYSCQAADMLKENFISFDPEQLPACMEALHHIEHTADLAKHDLMEKLLKEFITPIDREDIMELSSALDDVTDSLEDILLRLYMFRITSLREDAVSFVSIICDCCCALKKLMVEFPEFRKSKAIKDMIIEINHLEENGDKLYTEAMRRLYSESGDAVEILSWTAIYDRLEKCCDKCEDVADVVETVILKYS